MRIAFQQPGHKERASDAPLRRVNHLFVLEVPYSSLNTIEQKSAMKFQLLNFTARKQWRNER